MARPAHLPLPRLLWLLLAALGPLCGGAVSIATGRQRLLVEGLAMVHGTEEADALTFLVPHMPEGDAQTLPVQHIVTNIQLALQARHATHWAEAVPWPMFLNDVLPYAALSEPRDSWRPVFWDAFLPLVRNASSIKEAAVRLNRGAWGIVQPPIRFAPAPPDQITAYSPFQTMRAHNASCTGLAVFLVSACRAVGIPARVTGVPHWLRGPADCPHGDADPLCGNHNWVEVWGDGQWMFVDQDGELRLNSGPFYPSETGLQVDGTVNHSIYASSWASPSSATLPATWYPDTPAAGGHYPLVWDWTNTQVFAWDVTRRYLTAKFVPWP